MGSTALHARHASNNMLPDFFPGDIDDCPGLHRPRVGAGMGAAPNILLVCLDQIGLAHSSAFGGLCPMPAFEQLARTGRSHSGAAGKEQAGGIPLTRVLKKRGYATAHFGGCPGDNPLNLGHDFDHIDAMVGETLQFSPAAVTPPCHFTEYMTSRAIDWLDQQQKPFFLCWSPRIPRLADAVPRSWVEKHRQRFADKEMAALGGFLDYVDYQFSRLMSELEDRGLGEDTVILITGTNKLLKVPHLFTAMMADGALSAEETAVLVRAHINGRGGAEAYLQNASDWGRRAGDIPRWAQAKSTEGSLPGSQMIMYGPGANARYGDMARQDAVSLVMTAINGPDAKPDQCVVYPFTPQQAETDSEHEAESLVHCSRM